MSCITNDAAIRLFCSYIDIFDCVCVDGEACPSLLLLGVRLANRA